MDVVSFLKNSETAYLAGRNVRLFWQNAMEGYTEKITEHNRSIVSSGWHVITWKKSKPITLYFGDNFDDACKIFEKNC